jgi:predicted P-loop ATPase
LRGKLVIEVSEMHAYSRAATAHLKAFISRTHEKYRQPYARRETTEPRQCTFICTTNENTYLRDATGGRRFWPIATGEIDTTRLKADVGQLYAEAVALYHTGIDWWPTQDFENRLAAAEQLDRCEVNEVWESTIETYLKGKVEVTVGEIATECLMLERAQVGTRHHRDIADVLRHMGWIQAKRTGKRRPWVPKKA